MIYGLARISTSKQNIERQVRNMTAAYSDIIIFKEIFTGTKFQGRKELDKLLKIVKEGDTIVFDSVSRMSRNAEEGYALYEELFNRKINLVFLKEPHINTETYKKATENQISMTGQNVDIILEAVNRYLLLLLREQIQIAFNQSEKEVADLRQRTKEGILTARINGKQIGLQRGTKLITKKSVRAKELIKKYNKTFGGSNTNEETWRLIGISKATFYKYKNELLAEDK